MVVVVILRGVQLMLLPSKKLDVILEKQFKNHPVELPRRGFILDRNQQELAVSFETKSLFLNSKKMNSLSSLSKHISNILNIDQKLLEKKIRKRIGFTWIKRHLNKKEEKKIRNFLKKNPELKRYLGLAKEQKRLYPNNELASHILGFLGSDFHGLEGLEYYYEKELSGKGEFQRVVSGKVKEGVSLVITIDKELQSYIEQELEKAIKESNAKAGSAIVMDANNGDIWAMVSWPHYDLNRFRETSREVRRNRAISFMYEPGSTTKIILLGGALESGIITPSTKFYREGGRMKLGNLYIRDSNVRKEQKLQWLSAEEVIQVSSNIGATKIGFLYGKENLFNWYRKQGLGQKTQIDLPGEGSGSIKPPSKWSEVVFSNMTFGQGFAITPIQLIRAYAAIANGGFLVRPRIVKAFQYSNNEVVKKIPVEKERVLKKETAEELSRILSLVISNRGTGREAAIPGVAMAGKTGTAQISNSSGYIEGKYISSFIGYPLHIRPKLLSFFLIEEPDKDSLRFGNVATSVFKRTIESIISRSDITSSVKREHYAKIETKEDKRKRAIDSIKSKQIRRIASLKKRNISISVMPNFTGKTIKHIISFFNKQDIKLKIHGSGIVVKQHPEKGATLSSVKEAVIYMERSPLYK